MKSVLQRLRRVLVALMVSVVWLASPGCEPRSVEGALKPTVDKPVAVIEPQIPEFDLLISRRRQDAIERASWVRRWEAEALVHEPTHAQRKLVHREYRLRQRRHEQVSDLVPPGYRLLVLDVASRFGVDPRLLAAVGTVESQWFARARGRDGDSGLLQILPTTAAWIAGRMGLADYDLYDPLTNLSMGAWYLQALRSEHGSWVRALAAYNGGPRAAPLGGQHPYVGRVMKVYRRQGSNGSYVEPFEPR